MEETAFTEEESLKLWKFSTGWYRGGKLSGLFLAKEEDVEGLIGKTIYFGEVLGKHSEVVVTFGDRGYLTELLVSDSTIKELYDTCGHTICGYNPFSYLEEDED